MPPKQPETFALQIIFQWIQGGPLPLRGRDSDLPSRTSIPRRSNGFPTLLPGEKAGMRANPYLLLPSAPAPAWYIPNISGKRFGRTCLQLPEKQCQDMLQ